MAYADAACDNAFCFGSGSPNGRRLGDCRLSGFLADSSGDAGSSGVKTEAAFQPTKGLHGSMYFTLSLPVARFRLLAIRTGVGLVETASIVAVVCGIAGIFLPEFGTNESVADGLSYAATIFLCGISVYGLSALLATCLDQAWQVWGTVAAIFLLRWLFNTAGLPRSLDILRAMSSSSPLVSHTIPWAASASLWGSEQRVC